MRDPLFDLFCHLAHLGLVCLELWVSLDDEAFPEPFFMQLVDVLQILQAHRFFLLPASFLHPLEAFLGISPEVNMSMNGVQICQFVEVVKQLQIHLKLHLVHLALLQLQLGKDLLVRHHAPLREQKLLLLARHTQHVIELVGPGQKRVILEGIGPAMWIGVVCFEDVKATNLLPFTNRLWRKDHLRNVLS